MLILSLKNWIELIQLSRDKSFDIRKNQSSEMQQGVDVYAGKGPQEGTIDNYSPALTANGNQSYRYRWSKVEIMEAECCQ